MKTKFEIRTEGVTAYLTSIRKYDVLTPEQEEELFARIASGDEVAKNKIAESNQRFVFSIAKEYANDERILDYIQEGNRGLFEAINKFDYTRGFKFITYAKDLIRAYMNMYRADQALVKKSNNTKYAAKLKAIRNRFFIENEREATIDEIVDIFKSKYGITIVNKNDLLDLSMTRMSDARDEDGNTVEESGEIAMRTSSHNEYEDEIEKECKNEIINKCLKVLDERSRNIIKMSFGIGYENPICDDDIAEELNLTTMRIHQIKNEALKKMRLCKK